MSFVLVIEDDEDLRELLTLQLHRRGHLVLAAADGNAARELLRKCQPDVVVLDLNLPAVSGLELSREIHAEPRLRNTPVIAISAAVPFQAGPSPDLPVDAVLPKPFPMAELLTRVDAMTRERR